MGDAEETGSHRPVRRWRTLSEKRRIAVLTFEPGASVALVARAHDVNANQVFKWRRALKRGELNDQSQGLHNDNVILSYRDIRSRRRIDRCNSFHCQRLYLASP
jgi:transposase-like protein